MINIQKIVVAAIAVSLSTGCAARAHLGFDYGESFSRAFTTQADLTRTTIATSEYKLSGIEAASIRILVQEATTDAEGGGTESGE
jgi:hypothetical protein